MGLYEYVMSNPYDSSSNNYFYKNDETGIDFSILNNFCVFVNTFSKKSKNS